MFIHGILLKSFYSKRILEFSYQDFEWDENFIQQTGKTKQYKMAVPFEQYKKMKDRLAKISNKKWNK
jgi:hypothetical protein